MAILRRTERAMVRSMWCETDGEKEDRRPNGDVGIEGNSGSDGKGEWSEVVRTRVEEGSEDYHRRRGRRKWFGLEEDAWRAESWSDCCYSGVRSDCC